MGHCFYDIIVAVSCVVVFRNLVVIISNQFKIRIVSFVRRNASIIRTSIYIQVASSSRAERIPPRRDVLDILVNNTRGGFVKIFQSLIFGFSQGILVRGY